ncbi:TPR repeats containing protein [Clostridium cochlearium]|nr:TPR repeats containing protein [Clostridium cochlearium]
MLDNNKKALINFKAAWALNPNDSDCKKAISLIENKYKTSKDNL